MRSSASIYRIEPTICCPNCLRPRSSSPVIAQDMAGQSFRSAFIRAKKIEREYGRRLRSVARHVGDLVKGFDLENLTLTDTIRRALERYSETLKPWAEAVGNRMVAEVAARDERSWFQVAERMGNALRKEIAEAPIGQVMRARQDEQVRLITSLPREAAERVHAMTREGITKGWRADQIAAEIMKTGEVTKSRADLISITEVSRTSTLLTQARAEHVGSTSYVWRSAGDNDVRPDHKILNGKTFLWSDPPVADQRTGARAHPGCIYRCRCYPEPILDDL